MTNWRISEATSTRPSGPVSVAKKPMTGPDGRVLVASDIRQFVMIGICGGYTTFSSFSLQTLNLVQEGDMLRAGANIGGSVVLCLVAVWLGYVAAAALNVVRGS